MTEQKETTSGTSDRRPEGEQVGLNALVMPAFDDELRFILGRPNFTCSGTADILRKMGRDIPHKSEEEQAATIYYYLCMYAEHGAAWREKAIEELRDASGA